MKILFLTIKDNKHSKLLIDVLRKKHEVLVLFCTDPIHKKGLVRSIFHIIKKSGIRYFIYKVYEVLSTRCPYPRDIKTYLSKNINNQPELIKKINPDLILVSVFPLIINNEILRIPKYGCYNIHRSYLPYYKGKTSIFWVLANNEKETGVSIHETTEIVDEGKLIYRKKIEIKPDDDFHTLADRIAISLRKDILKFVDNIEKNKIKNIKIKSEGNYVSFPDRDATKRYFNRKAMLKRRPINYLFKFIPNI